MEKVEKGDDMEEVEKVKNERRVVRSFQDFVVEDRCSTTDSGDL